MHSSLTLGLASLFFYTLTSNSSSASASQGSPLRSVYTGRSPQQSLSSFDHHKSSSLVIPDCNVMPQTDSQGAHTSACKAPGLCPQCAHIWCWVRAGSVKGFGRGQCAYKRPVPTQSTFQVTSSLYLRLCTYACVPTPVYRCVNNLLPQT